MSMTFLLKKDPTIRSALSQWFTKPRLVPPPAILVPRGSSAPAEIGTAFDYLLRFFLNRNVADTRSSLWVAESATIFVSGERRKHLMSILTHARAVESEYIATGNVTDELMAVCVDLARADLILRIGRTEFLGTPVLEESVRELWDLFNLLDPGQWQADRPCILNPTFGEASSAVGGADADLIWNGHLIEVKTSSRPGFQLRDFQQIVCYYLLHRIAGVGSGMTGGGVNGIGFYLSRAGVRVTWRIEELIGLAQLEEATEWMNGYLQSKPMYQFVPALSQWYNPPSGTTVVPEGPDGTISTSNCRST